LRSVWHAQSQKKTSADAADFADKEEEIWFRLASGETLDALQILLSLHLRHLRNLWITCLIFGGATLSG
jgi:hypothetical protein